MSSQEQQLQGYTERQVALMGALIEERQVPEELAEHLRDLYRAKALTKTLASQMLTLLDRFPMKTDAQRNLDRETELVGFHLHGTQIVRVVKNSNGSLRTRVLRKVTADQHRFDDKAIPLEQLNKSTRLNNELVGIMSDNLNLCFVCSRKSKHGIHENCADRIG